jgi:hypothetical protein
MKTNRKSADGSGEAEAIPAVATQGPAFVPFALLPYSLIPLLPSTRSFLGQQPVEIAPANFPRFFIESPESRAL